MAPLIGILELAKLFLQGVLYANAAAFACMKALVSAFLFIDYAKLEAGLSSNVLSSYISASLKFTVSGKQFGFNATINLSNLLSIITDIFNKCVDYFKSLFPVEEAAAMLLQEKYSPASMTSLLQPENVYLLQAKLGHRNKALEPDSDAAAAAAAAADAAGVHVDTNQVDDSSGETIFDPAIANEAYDNMKDQEGKYTMETIKIEERIKEKEEEYKAVLEKQKASVEAAQLLQAKKKAAKSRRF